MALFDFVKDAGEKLTGLAGDLFGGGEAAAAEAGPQISESVRKHGVEVDGLQVELDGDTVVLNGKAATQAEREKAILIAGNTHGVAKVDDRIEVAAPEPDARFYTVVCGDTLSKIAKAEYGDAMKYPRIFEANQPMLSNPDKIYPGQVLRIPPGE